MHLPLFMGLRRDIRIYHEGFCNSISTSRRYRKWEEHQRSVRKGDFRREGSCLPVRRPELKERTGVKALAQHASAP